MTPPATQVLPVGSPVPGRCVSLTEVPDEVFASAMVGPGTAVDPAREPAAAAAPVDGTLVKLHPHAFVIVSDRGIGILVHLGIDTVRRKGEGFELLAREGDRVHAGQPLIRWDPSEVERSGYNPVCPVVALDVPAETLVDVRESGTVAVGEALFALR